MDTGIAAYEERFMRLALTEAVADPDEVPVGAVIVRGGRAWARLLWSSAYYDYMIVDDAWFYNLTTDGGNSAFEIPITRMDDPISVVADTTAMGDALEIDYTLTFYSDSVGSKGQIPQEAAKKVLILAGTIIAAGGVLNYFVKKRRER